MFRYLIIALVIILGLLQYRLWIGHDGLHEYYALKQEIAGQKQQNQQLEKRNQALNTEINNLKKGHGATEEDARNQLGMIKPGETFYQVTK